MGAAYARDGADRKPDGLADPRHRPAHPGKVDDLSDARRRASPPGPALRHGSSSVGEAKGRECAGVHRPHEGGPVEALAQQPQRRASLEHTADHRDNIIGRAPRMPIVGTSTSLLC